MADKKSTMGSDLGSYTRRKINEIDEPRYAKLIKQLQSSERPVGGTYLEPRSLKDSAKVLGYGALGAYGVGPATVVDGGINTLNAAGDAANKARKKVGSRAKEGAIKAAGAMVKAGTAFKSAKKEVGSRLKSGVPSAINAVGKVGNTAIQKAADATKRLSNSVFGKDAKAAASKDTEKKAKGGSVGSASRRADGCAIRGKTRGRVS